MCKWTTANDGEKDECDELLTEAVMVALAD